MILHPLQVAPIPGYGEIFGLSGGTKFITWIVSYDTPPEGNSAIDLEGSFDGEHWFIIDKCMTKDNVARNLTTNVDYVRCHIVETGGENLYLLANATKI